MVVALSGEHMAKEAMSARTRTESSSGAGTVAASLAAIGSVLAASSCCLPLFPFMMAAGLAGTSGFLTEVRPYLLVGSILFIAFGFYQARRARKCNRRTSTVALMRIGGFRLDFHRVPADRRECDRWSGS